MANSSHPRKFSEKMAVLNQRQAIYTAETEEIIREVTELRKVIYNYLKIDLELEQLTYSFSVTFFIFFSSWKPRQEQAWDPMGRPLLQLQVAQMHLPVPAESALLLTTEGHPAKT